MADTQFDRLEKIVYDNDLEALKQAIESGNMDVNFQNKYGWTPLHMAIRRDRREMVEYLVGQGADIDRVDGAGWTPLMEAVMDDMPELCKLLLDNGADVTIANARGGTAPMLVQKFGRSSMVKYFS
ncbi:ankyrin repeat domain-containing protein [bacterium]|nr:ankyrin repeat domain-containing protein [bacterium]MBU1958182.1 ankyrin repeat domain-containing protein [bacterium]